MLNQSFLFLIYHIFLTPFKNEISQYMMRQVETEEN